MLGEQIKPRSSVFVAPPVRMLLGLGLNQLISMALSFGTRPPCPAIPLLRDSVVPCQLRAAQLTPSLPRSLWCSGRRLGRAATICPAS